MLVKSDPNKVIAINQIAGVILAGGRSSRMGKDKSFLALNGKTLIERVIERAKPQVDTMVISTNDHSDQYQSLNFPLISDTTTDLVGPLAGLLAAMDYLIKNKSDASHLASFPVDSPFFPQNLVEQLSHALQSQALPIAIPRYRGRAHWAFGLWSVQLAEDLRNYLVDPQQRKVHTWIEQNPHCFVDFDCADPDPFFNINTPEDFIAANARLA